MKGVIALSLIGLFLLLLISLLFFVQAQSDTSIFVATIINNSVTELIKVVVPDRVILGNVTIGRSSEEVRVWVNNTGSVAIKVTPGLINTSDSIFRNLYFRKFQTRNFTKIGEFNFNISAPSKGKTYEDEYFWVILNLTDYTGPAIINATTYEAAIRFSAVKQ